MKTTDIFKIRPINEENNDFIITIGNHLATEKHFKTIEDAEKYIKFKNWDMIFALIAEMIEISKTKIFTENQENNEQKNKE